MPAKRVFQELPIDRVRTGTTCREPEEDRALQELSDSVKDHGLLQPLLVRSDGSEGFLCIIGGRRLQAARLAGLTTVSCLVIDGETSQADVLEKQLVENIHRKDLGPIERANAYAELMQLRGWSQRELARRIHIDQSTVSDTLALLKLAPPVRDLVEAEQLPPSTAVTLKDEPPAVQVEEARRMAEEGTSRAEARRRGKAQPKVFNLQTPAGWKVSVTATRSRASRAELLAELEGLVAQLRGADPQEGRKLAA
jgi:ParB family chromosome partitioning protein